MLTLANVFSCRLNPMIGSSVPGSHISQVQYDLRECSATQLTSGYFGQYNQTPADFDPACTVPLVQYKKATGLEPLPPPSFCHPSLTTTTALHIYPTFVNVTNIKGSPVFVRQQHPLSTELTGQARLPPISMFSSSLHHSDPRNNNTYPGTGDRQQFCNESDQNHNVLAACTAVTQAYCAEVEKTKKIFSSKRNRCKHRSTKKFQNPDECNKQYDPSVKDLSHSIASILSKETILNSIPVQPTPVSHKLPTSIIPIEEKVFNTDTPSLHDNTSVHGDDKSDVDVTSCSDDEVENVSMTSSSYDTGEHGTPNILEMRDVSGNVEDLKLIPQDDSCHRLSQDTYRTVAKNTHNELPHSITEISPQTPNVYKPNGSLKHCHPVLHQNVISSGGATLPPIESLRHPNMRHNFSEGSGAFKPISKTWTRDEQPNMSCTIDSMSHGNNNSSKNRTWNAHKNLHCESKKICNSLTTKNRSLSVETKVNTVLDKIDHTNVTEKYELLCLRQGIANKNFGLTAARNTTNSLGTWFQWLRQRDSQACHTFGPMAGSQNVARCPPPRYFCEACNKTYSTFGGLSKHRQFHCSEHVRKEFACNMCSKSYSSLGALKMHIRTHTLPCKCQVCGKAFSRPWLLQGHVRTHTGEKPFRCNHCGRAFADRSNLRAHLQTHAEVKKYACRKCGKTFSRMSLLTKHSESSCPGQHLEPVMSAMST